MTPSSRADAEPRRLKGAQAEVRTRNPSCGSAASLSLGVEVHRIDGVAVPIFNPPAP